MFVDTQIWKRIFYGKNIQFVGACSDTLIPSSLVEGTNHHHKVRHPDRKLTRKSSIPSNDAAIPFKEHALTNILWITNDLNYSQNVVLFASQDSRPRHSGTTRYSKWIQMQNSCRVRIAFSSCPNLEQVNTDQTHKICFADSKPRLHSLLIISSTFFMFLRWNLRGVCSVRRLVSILISIYLDSGISVVNFGTHFY